MLNKYGEDTSTFTFLKYLPGLRQHPPWTAVNRATVHVLCSPQHHIPLQHLQLCLKIILLLHLGGQLEIFNIFHRGNCDFIFFYNWKKKTTCISFDSTRHRYCWDICLTRNIITEFHRLNGILIIQVVTNWGTYICKECRGFSRQQWYALCVDLYSEIFITFY